MTLERASRTRWRRSNPRRTTGDVLDPSRYYSREFMDKEWKYLWPRVWLLAGVTSDIPEDGDYTVFNHGHESFVIVRQEDGGIRAFFNACPHRGNQIALNERGSVAKFTCAFHAWRFCLDGKLDCITDEHCSTRNSSRTGRA